MYIHIYCHTVELFIRMADRSWSLIAIQKYLKYNYGYMVILLSILL